MTLSEWDGTAWGGTAVHQAKAATGIGVSMIEYGTPYLLGRERMPQNLMKRAQAAYHSNPWIRLAESTVTRRMVGLPWHLEDEADEEIEETTPGAPKLIRDLLERPQLRLTQRQPAISTRRGMTALTCRHIGLCGMAYWYLDQREATTGIPLGILYINPARMFPLEDEAGNLLAWALDATTFDHRGQPRDGIRLSMDEVLPFYLDPPDSGNIGSGIYEAAALKAQITNLGDSHAGYVLGSGGRIAGIVSPKEGSLTPEQFRTLEREFANVVDVPDAAKRTTILSGPIDFTKTAADPTELDLKGVGQMNRDDILAVWGVPPATAGIPAPAGLNSGGTRGYDEAVLMQGSVHDRVVSIKETIQYGFLDRLNIPTIEYEIDEPEFDDSTPLYENANRAGSLPLTNKERREIIGLEPFGDQRDDEVWLPATLVPVYEVNTQAGAEVVPPPAPAAGPAEEGSEAEELPAKAGQREFLGLRRTIGVRWVPKFRRDVAKVLDEQRDEIVAKLRRASAEVMKRHRADPDYWWNAKREDARMAQAIGGNAAGIAETVVTRTSKLLPKPAGKADTFADTVSSRVARSTASRVKGINDTTRQHIAKLIAEGFDEGLSPEQVADRLEQSTTFDASRAELIARTESMFAYNSAALASYDEFGVTQVEAIDGDEDPECAERDGQTFTLSEAEAIEDHPNGTLDWVPVL